jgi:hypothetical protein
VAEPDLSIKRTLTLDAAGVARELRLFNDSGLQRSIAQAIADLEASSPGKTGALIADANLKDAGLALVAKLPHGWSVGGFVRYEYQSKDLSGSAFAKWSW